MKALITCSLLLLSLFSASAGADAVLMVHGYLGDATSWERSLISQTLDANGLSHGGRFVAGPGGPVLMVPRAAGGDGDGNGDGDKVYLAELPSLLPAAPQAELLQRMIAQLEQVHPGENITLIGHSAGGVVARLALVRHRPASVTRLVTIASPHLGTWRARQALKLTNNHGPFNAVKSIVGGSEYDALRHSRGLLVELAGTRPGSMLHWLNSREHPDIEYISVIRSRPNGITGDDIVPGYSQDMNNITALAGRSRVIITPSGHGLKPADADLILGLLARAR